MGGSPRPLVPSRKEGSRLLYGINPVSEALTAGHEILKAHVTDAPTGRLADVASRLRDKGVSVGTATRDQLEELSGSPQHQGVVAEVAPLANGSLTGLIKDHPDLPLTVLIADHIQDPHNLGALYRAADALGVHLIFLPANDAASHQLASVAKASSGAVEHVPSVVVGRLQTALEELTGHGFKVLGLESDPAPGSAGGDPVPLRDCVDIGAPRVALVVGHEGAGLTAATKKGVHGLVLIPMGGKVSSLNASVACGIALYERSRRLAGGS